MNNNKDVIYIDIDDEITGIIEKVRESDKKIVALVLPKRATVLQSIVNMKLLKRISTEASKSLVLITSDSGLLPIAGAVGLHVAKTLNSKPVIPKPPTMKAAAEAVNEETATDTEPELDPNTPVGELAGDMEPEKDDEDEETIEVDNVEEDDDRFAAPAEKKNNKRLHIPNFERFRLLLVLGAFLLVLLIAGWIYAVTYMPKAAITIKTDNTKVNTKLVMTVSTAQKTLDTDKDLVPATTKSLNKTDSEKVAATGQKDIGTKATGSVMLKNCTKSDETVSVPAGTGVSSGNLTFIIQEAVSLPASSFSGGGTCNTPSVEVDVIAQNAGDKYNLSDGRSYTVAGYSSVTATGKAMSGGTSKVIKVVSEKDVTDAKAKLSERANNNAANEIKDLFKADGMIGLTDTIGSEAPEFTTTPNVGDEAAEVTVKSTTKYTMLGVQEEYVRQLIEDNVKKNIDVSKQVILDNGLEKASYALKEKRSNTEYLISLSADSLAGPDLNQDAIKKEIAGKKRGETQQIIQNRPGIKEVTVKYSPFWVTKTPKNLNKITVTFQQSSDGDK